MDRGALWSVVVCLQWGVHVYGRMDTRQWWLSSFWLLLSYAVFPVDIWCVTRWGELLYVVKIRLLLLLLRYRCWCCMPCLIFEFAVLLYLPVTWWLSILRSAELNSAFISSALWRWITCLVDTDWVESCMISSHVIISLYFTPCMCWLVIMINNIITLWLACNWHHSAYDIVHSYTSKCCQLPYLPFGTGNVSYPALRPYAFGRVLKNCASPQCNRRS